MLSYFFILQYAYARRADKIITQQNKSQPMFLYLPFQSVHQPIQVSCYWYVVLALLYMFSNIKKKVTLKKTQEHYEGTNHRHLH